MQWNEIVFHMDCVMAMQSMWTMLHNTFFFLYRKFTMQQQHPPKWIVRLALPVGKNVAKNLEKKTFRMKMFSFILNSKHFWKRLERTPNLCQSLVKRFGAFSPKPFYKFQISQKNSSELEMKLLHSHWKEVWNSKRLNKLFSCVFVHWALSFLCCVKKKMVAILTYPMIVYKRNSIGIMCNRCGCLPF